MQLKHLVKKAIATLMSEGEVIMLTGDNENTQKRLWMQ
jgi:cation transport ATPase